MAFKLGSSCTERSFCFVAILIAVLGRGSKNICRAQGLGGVCTSCRCTADPNDMRRRLVLHASLNERNAPVDAALKSRPNIRPIQGLTRLLKSEGLSRPVESCRNADIVSAAGRSI